MDLNPRSLCNPLTAYVSQMSLIPKLSPRIMQTPQPRNATAPYASPLQIKGPIPPIHPKLSPFAWEILRFFALRLAARLRPEVHLHQEVRL